MTAPPTLAQITGLVPPRFGSYVPARHPALRYAIALNDRGYFWESQEILETVWAAAPQSGRRRRRLFRWVSERAPCGAAYGQTGAAAARQDRLDGFWRRQLDMKQNACFCVLD
jgi:DUF309 family protein family protein